MFKVLKDLLKESRGQSIIRYYKVVLASTLPKESKLGTRGGKRQKEVLFEEIASIVSLLYRRLFIDNCI